MSGQTRALFHGDGIISQFEGYAAREVAAGESTAFDLRQAPPPALT